MLSPVVLLCDRLMSCRDFSDSTNASSAAWNIGVPAENFGWWAVTVDAAGVGSGGN